MRSFVAVLSTVVAISVSPALAHADTFAQYTLQAQVNVSPASGTITFNETKNLITGGTIMIEGYTLDFSTTSNSPYVSSRFTDAGGDTFDLNIPEPTSTFTGGYICSISIPFCELPRTGNQPTMFYVALPGGMRRGETAGTGTLTAIPNVATTPEPSSLALLCTGLLCMTAVVRRTRLGS